MNSPKANFSFQLWDSSVIPNKYSPRIGEVRIGDYLQTQVLSDAKYVIIGIRECCGPS